MTPERSNGPGYIPRLLAAAAFVTRRATDASLSELRLTQDRVIILSVLARTAANEAAIAAHSGLAPDVVRECLAALECCGYAAATNSGTWSITATGAQIQSQVEDTGDRLLEGADDEALRRELSGLIRALRPPNDGAAPQQPVPGPEQN